MIPYSDINPTRRFAWVTLAIIIANAIIFLFVEPTLTGNQATQQEYFLCNAEIPYEVTHQTNLAEGGPSAVTAIANAFNVSPAEASQLQATLRQDCPGKNWLASVFFAMFLHVSFLHIAGNMLYLWVFGNNVEDRMGRIRFVLFYFASGLAAAGLQLALGANSAVPNLGASGAIAGVLGSYLILYPRARVRTLIVIFPVTIRAEYVLGFWFLLQFINGAGSLGTNSNGGVAYWAHVGGFVFGVIVTLLFFGGGAARGGEEERRPSWYPTRY